MSVCRRVADLGLTASSIQVALKTMTCWRSDWNGLRQSQLKATSDVSWRLPCLPNSATVVSLTSRSVTNRLETHLSSSGTCLPVTSSDGGRSAVQVCESCSRRKEPFAHVNQERRLPGQRVRWATAQLSIRTLPLSGDGSGWGFRDSCSVRCRALSAVSCPMSCLTPRTSGGVNTRLSSLLRCHRWAVPAISPPWPCRPKPHRRATQLPTRPRPAVWAVEILGSTPLCCSCCSSDCCPWRWVGARSGHGRLDFFCTVFRLCVDCIYGTE